MSENEQLPRYKDEQWLRDQYLSEQRSMDDIADEFSVDQKTIQYWIDKFEIETRERWKVNRLNSGYRDRFHQILVGELLGDGNLFRKSDRGGVVYQHSTSKPGYVEWLRAIFENEGFETRSYSYTETDDRFGDVEVHKLATLSYEDLVSEYDRWYNSGEKIVPDTIELTPIVLRQWYLGDGCRSVRSDGRVTVRLSTEGFTDECRAVLVDKMNRSGIDATQNQQGQIYVPKRSHQRFFEYMSSYPEELADVYGYKWPTVTQ